MKKLFALLLAVVMVLSMVACSNNKPADTTGSTAGTTADDTTTSAGPVEYVDPYADMEYDEQSAALYEDLLGEFYAAYEVAKEAETQGERFALMAVAEAKLMEASVMLPLTAQGGNYAISRVAPYTAPYAAWGNDDARYHNLLICTMPLTSADRAEMKAKWAELKSEGTGYYEWAKEYLTGKGYELKDTYTLNYSGDPKTWDVLATSRAADSEAIINTYDGLAEYDCQGNLQPALAESWEVSDDGLTWTFHLRQGVKWVDSQGRAVADVKADDFVAGMQHMMDACGGLEYLVQGIIVNANEYIAGEVTDFSQVGVSAPDDSTVVYTLLAPCTYFDSMLGYGVFAPMSRDYYLSQGGQFGADYDSSAETYLYGSDPDHIAYCGPYLVTNATAENTIVFSANPSYWNADNITMKTITWLYNDGSDQTKYVTDCVSGVIDGVGLNSARLELMKAQALPDGYVSATGATNWFDEFGYIASTNATSFMGFFNVNRIATANVTDQAVQTSKDDEAVARATAALRNVHFRRAVAYAVDRASYNAQSVGEDLKLTSLRNCYTPGTFVSLPEETTIDINGTATTYPAGTYYGKVMQDQLDADGSTVKVWDPAAEEGLGSSDGFDGWFNPDAAVAELQTAVEELAAIGIEVSAENPIYLDLPYPSNEESYTNKANAFKQSVDSVLGGAVIVNLTECVDYAEWYYTGYYTDYGYEANYDIYDLSGWGPDYADPSTYLDTFLPDYAGYMIKCIGLF